MLTTSLDVLIFSTEYPASSAPVFGVNGSKGHFLSTDLSASGTSCFTDGCTNQHTIAFVINHELNQLFECEVAFGVNLHWIDESFFG